MTEFNVVPRPGFEEDPFETEEEFLIDDRFADALIKLEPSWTSMSGQLLGVLRAFDEAALLRPRFRARLPFAYAQYEYDRQFVRDDETREEWEEFDAIRYALMGHRRHFEDPASVHPVQASSRLRQYLLPSTPDERVDWREWTHRVSQHEAAPGVVRPITRTSVKSLYAEWQRLRAWALLESHTVRFLINPKEGGPERIFRDRNYDLSGRWLMSQGGSGRYDVLLTRLETDGWLAALYRSRALVEWADLRTWEPAYQRVDSTESSLTPDERWEIEKRRLISRCETLAKRWTQPLSEESHWPTAQVPEAHGNIPIAFRNRIRALLAVWHDATDGGHTAFANAIRDDLASASSWAIFAFQTSFVENDAQVGALDFYGKASLGLALRPERTRSRQTVERHGQYLIPSFNATIAQPQLDGGDFSRFLDFLDENELWAWTVELSNLIDFQAGPPDTARDRRFLHLRSLSLLNEQISALLVERYGKQPDRSNIGRGTVEGSLKVFLAGRPDWRHDLWTAVASNDAVTKTNDASSPRAVWDSKDEMPVRLTKCVQAIDALKLPKSIEGAARQLLLLWTLRNFGAHRFSRDAQLLDDLGPRFAGAAIWSPLFYWKIATTMG